MVEDTRAHRAETSLMPSPLSERPALRRSETPIERVLPFVRTLRGYGAAPFRADFVAGITVALFTIPQAMAYALIAGFPPAAGIATAVAASEPAPVARSRTRRHRGCTGSRRC